MAFSLQAFGFFSSLVDDEDVKGGSLERSITISVDGEVSKEVESIANGANTVVYSNSPASFNFMYLASDYNTRALISDNTGNTFSLTLRGTGVSKKYGIPVMIGSPYTSNSSGVINSITVFNESGNTAKVKCVAVK